MLFPWAYARVFGALNDIPACANGWSRPHIGPLFRGERMRFYGNSIRESKLAIVISGFLSAHGTVIRNTALEALGHHYKDGHLFVWDQIPHWSDYFGPLKEYRDLLKKLVWSAVTSSVRMQVMNSLPPTIAVHIRCGEFRKLAAHEDFALVGSARTPLEYFIGIVSEVRECCGYKAPVTVFTDGHPSEVEAVLRLPNVVLAARNRPIVDMLLMSRAQLIVASASSTFGMWAGFLADSPLLLHPDHIHAALRPKSINDKYYEGAAIGSYRNWPDLLVKNILQIHVATN